jgi:serine/threonine-protein kinase
MAELAVRAKYESTGVPVVRTLLKGTFPVWGLAFPIMTAIGLALFLIMLVEKGLNLGSSSSDVLKAVWVLISCSAASMVGLTLTRLFNKNELIVDKSGIRFPIMPDQLGASLKYFNWDSIQRFDVSNADQPIESRDLYIFTANSPKPITLQLKKLNPDETEQILLAVELWSKGCQLGENVAVLRSDIKQIALGTNDLSYTDMWEDELRRRYCPTNFLPLEPGRTLKGGTVKVIRHLALGGLAAVYLCDRGEGTDLVVIKEAVIPEDAQESVKAKAKEMFEREAQLLMKLEHPGIVKVHDYFVEGGRTYLMLQYLNGQDIRQFVRQNGPQREQFVIDSAIKIASIMKYLHEQEPPVIHRDLTPDNLVVTEDGSIVVIDFGAANEFIGQATGTLVGKQAYISPEQFRGRAVVESDVYAFGCTLYYMLTGHEPEALSTSNPKDRRDDLSPEICELIESCTQMEPEDRYRSAVQLIPVLRRIAAAQAGVN